MNQPLIYRYGGAATAATATQQPLPDDVECRTLAITEPGDALREAARHAAGRGFVLLHAEAKLPEYWLPRLRSALTAEPTALCVSPLALDSGPLDPLPAGTRDDLDAIDRRCHALAERSPSTIAAWLPAVSLWREGLDATQLDGVRSAQLPAGGNALLCDMLCVRADAGSRSVMTRQLGTVPLAVAAVGQRIAKRRDSPARAGVDPRPVLLHILHGWGGGVARFVSDLIAADNQRVHRVLISNGQYGHGNGLRLTLHADPESPPLREWTMSSPIDACAIHSHEYAAVLGQVIDRESVAGLLISSLIGHSLDALQSGLPTTVVCHDYFPVWPLLHDAFDDSSRDFSAAAIEPMLRGAPSEWVFAERDPRYWHALRQGWLDAVAQRHIPLIAPSHSVRNNLLRMEPTLAAADWKQIEHGLQPWAKSPQPIITDASRDALRVVVVGRINGGKGEDLLSDVLPRLPHNVEVVLLGCGRAGMRFFGLPRVHIQMNYRRDALPSLLASLQPDAALLASSVPETWSYTLSELWNLGVPVIATALGSFAERISDGENGLLVPPNADAILSCLRKLAGDRKPLQALRDRAPVRAARSTSAMAMDYLQAMPLSAALSKNTETLMNPDQLRLLQAQLQHHQVNKALHDATRRIDEQQTELVRRGDWAQSLDRELAAKSRWAESLVQQLDTTRSDYARLEHDFAERGNAMTQQQQALNRLEHEFDDRTRWALELDRELNELQAERARIVSSLSWRVTRPFRFARRKLGALLARLRFTGRRVDNLRHRGLRSLKSRGVRGSIDRLKQEFHADVAVDAPAIPSTGPFVPFTLPTSESPRVSVIIPAYNHFDATHLCLKAIAETTESTPFEVILVDDCGSDETAEQAPRIDGLRFFRNENNLGFIGACNRGAAEARGEFVLFLNNDTAVQPGWLDALIRTFDDHDKVGLVGSKLVYPDGRLQEAGGIVFSDGSGWNYGRFDDPAKPAYNFVREVDYCSGAAIMLRRALFDQFDGFDSHYSPAYYEDTDLAMKVRQAGLRVLYQPASVVVHFEGITSGTDTGSGVKAYQVSNQQKFLDRWRDALGTQPRPGTDIVIARQHRCRRHVLVIDATTPQPDHDSGSLRLVNILRLLLEDGCAVTFFADNRAFAPGYSQALQQLGVEVLWHPHIDPPKWLAENGPRLDLVFVSRHYIASNYLELVRLHAPRARFAFDTVDLHYLREQRAAELEGRDDLRRSAAETRARELRLIRQSDVTLVVSHVEQELLARDAPGARVDILSNVHAIAGAGKPFAERHDLVFVGGFQHPPNVDAASWFVREIFPLVLAEEPDIRLHLIGSKAGDAVRALGDLPGVQFHGFVADIDPYMDGCRLAVAPLRYGAGVKGKVNLSMAHGQPVVATPIAVEGMFVEAGREVLVADEPAAFAREVLRGYRDEMLWNSLAAAGLTNVETHFGFDSARTALRRLMAEP